MRRVTQQELADRLGLWRHTIMEIERGRVSISEQQYHAIIAAIRDLCRERANAETGGDTVLRQ